MWNKIECSLLSAATNRVQSTSFSACEICRREETLVSFVWERLGCIWGLGFLRESLYHSCNLPILYETFSQSPPVDVGRLSNHRNSCVLCVYLLFILSLLLLVWVPGMLFAQYKTKYKSAKISKAKYIYICTYQKKKKIQ